MPISQLSLAGSSSGRQLMAGFGGVVRLLFPSSEYLFNNRNSDIRAIDHA